MDQSFVPEYRRHLQAEWGERADAIFHALLAEARKIPRANRFHAPDLKSPYHLDPASILPAVALDVQPGLRVLDLCAAPGGKTLVLAESLFLSADVDLVKEGYLVANEISDGRRTRLKNTIRDFVDSEFANQIRVTGYDASKWGLNEKEAYDRILVDAPCSGDRFFLKKLHNQQLHDTDGEEVEDFRPGRNKRLAIRQYAILASAWMALKPGGRLVYSTCAVSAVENDKVVAKLLKRQGQDRDGNPALRVVRDMSDRFRQVALEHGLNAEPLEHGFIVLPDLSQGAGPIYFSVLEKC